MYLKSSSVDARPFNSSTAELYFRCLPANDPELKRPDFKTEPATVVEVDKK
jgi:hypothetical protein